MSVSANTLRKLAALKLDHSQMAGVLELLADQQEAEEARKEAQRERTRRSRAKRDGNVTDTSQSQGGNVEVSPKKETSPTPPKEKTTPSSEPNGSSKNRAVRIPVEFEPDLGWAVGAGMSHSQALTESEQFRDYWTAKPGKDGTKLDWPATWRQWVRNQLKRRPASRASPPRQPNVADGFAALSREIENRNDPRSSPSDESPRRSIPHLSGVQVG